MKDDGLQINEDRAYQTRFWRAQRVAWAVLAGLLVLAALGLTGGSGWYSQSLVGDAGFSVSYPAVLRQQTTGSFVVKVANPAKETVLHFDTVFLDSFEITAMTPPATAAFGTATGVAYRFAAAGQGPVTVRIKVEADRPAVADYAIVADGHLAMLTTTVLP